MRLGQTCPGRIPFYNMTTFDCLLPFVGLADCACPCTEDVAPEGWNTSDSGLYIADLLSPIGALGPLDDCSGTNNPWNVLASGRRQAINAFVGDLPVVMSKRNKAARAEFSGTIGKATGRNVVNTSATYAGMRIYCESIRDGIFEVTKIGGVFNASGTVSVTVYNQDNEEVAGPYTLTTTAGNYVETTLPEALSLPMYLDNGGNAEYFFAYAVNQSNLPRQVDGTCGCGGFFPYFDLSKPFMQGQTGSRAFSNWMMVGGFTSDSLTEFDLFRKNCKSVGIGTYGLTITATLKCDAARFACVDGYDYTNPIHRTIAHAIYYKAAAIAIGQMLLSPVPTRGAVVNRDGWMEAKLSYEGEYNMRMTYIGEKADPTAGGCLMCKTPQISSGTVLA